MSKAREVDAGSAADEELLPGSNFNRVVRVGGTVRREKTGAWTATVHALLRHLERAGFDGAPRALGMDERDREVLTFVPGEMLRDVLPPPDDTARWEALLLAAGRLLRRYHDAAESFIAPPDAQWQRSWFTGENANSIVSTVAPAVAGNVVCHNDPTPGNTVAVEGAPVALIDWDFAHPAPRAWDIAQAMGHFTRFPSDEPSLSSAERGRRMRVFCQGYGLAAPADRRGLLDVIVVQLRSLYERLKTLAAEGDPFCVMAWEKTNGGRPILDDIAYLREHRSALGAAFESNYTGADGR